MPVVAAIGGQWGDEGKGKLIDLLAAQAKVVVRFSGGDNAGHTVNNPYGEFRLHLVPSGIFYPGVTCIIGNGVVINPAVLIQEIDDIRGRGVGIGRLIISERAHLIMPYHLLLDGLEEDAKGKGALGTTRRGVGPAFVDKIARLGIRTCDLLDREALRSRLRPVLEHKNAILEKVYGHSPLSFDQVYSQCCSYAERLAPFIQSPEPVLEEALHRGDVILLEGAQGTMLDPDFGTYPYVTSSTPMAGGACSGTGLSPSRIDKILGVFKAYTTRVGGGPMPTELKDEVGNQIRERGHEYGTTTGRARRCGWFDAVAGRFSAAINGFNGLALMRLDILDSFPTIKICTGYEVEGKPVPRFPASLATLERCLPAYEELPGWQAPTTEVRQLNHLPPAAINYVQRLESLLSCPLDIISVGPHRDQTILVRPPF